MNEKMTVASLIANALGETDGNNYVKFLETPPDRKMGDAQRDRDRKQQKRNREQKCATILDFYDRKQDQHRCQSGQCGLRINIPCRKQNILPRRNTGDNGENPIRNKLRQHGQRSQKRKTDLCKGQNQKQCRGDRKEHRCGDR